MHVVWNDQGKLQIVLFHPNVEYTYYFVVKSQGNKQDNQRHDYFLRRMIGLCLIVSQ